MKKIAIGFVTLLLSVSVAFAQGEEKTLIQKLSDKFFSKAKKTEAAKPQPKAAVAVKPVKETAPAAPTKAAPKTAGKAKETAPAKKMTKAEMLADIKESLDNEKEIFDYIPELKKSKNKEGKNIYNYIINKQALSLDALDEATLEKLQGRVHQVEAKIRADNINRQLETIRQAQQASAQAPRPPVVVMPPQPPRPPVTAPIPPRPPEVVTAPRAPSIPPQPPRR